MIRGPARTVSGACLVFNALGQEYGPGIVGFEMLECILEMNSAGLAEIEVPFVSGYPSLFQVVRGTGAVQPAAAFDVYIAGKFGRLAQGIIPIKFASSILAAGVVADTVPTTASDLTTSRLCGPLIIRIQNSSASNSGKQVTIAFSIGSGVRTFTT